MAATAPCNKWLVPALGVVFFTWLISLGGLGSVQAWCEVDSNEGTAHMNGVRGFSAQVQGCTTIFRYYWFIIGFEFCLIAGLALAAGSGVVAQARLAFVGLFAVATILYMQTTDSFLTGLMVPFYQWGQTQNSDRTMIAGSLLTVLANLAIVTLLGSDCDSC